MKICRCGITIQGMINCYNGADLKILRAPFLEYIRSVYDVTVHPEDETQPGEYYIDCLGVYPEHQGKDIGKNLIAGLAEHATAKCCDVLGLLVKKTIQQHLSFIKAWVLKLPTKKLLWAMYIIIYN